MRLLSGTPYCGTCANRIGERCRYFGRPRKEVLKSDPSAVAFKKIQMGAMTCMFWKSVT